MKSAAKQSQLARDQSPSSTSDFSENDNPFNDILINKRMGGQSSFGTQGSFLKEEKKQEGVQAESATLKTVDTSHASLPQTPND